MFKNIIFMFLICFSMNAFADNEPREVTDRFKIPSDLSDCNIYRVESDGLLTKVLYITRCGNQVNTTTNDKYPVSNSLIENDKKSSNTITLNGETYIRADSVVDTKKSIMLDNVRYIKLN